MGSTRIMMAVRAARVAVSLVAIAGLVWVGACRSDGIGGPTAVIDPFVVSDPLAMAVAGGAEQAALSGSRNLEVVFVSLRDSTITGSGQVNIHNTSTGKTVSVFLGEGGFDPVPVTAAAGDSLVVEIGTELRPLVVRGAVRPRVVRTNPRRGRRDLPLNAVIVVVFTEPVAPASLTPASIRLLRGTEQVTGTASLLAGSATAAVFTPDVPLAPNTDYVLRIGDGVTDLGGAPLEAIEMVEFSTGTAELGSTAWAVDVLPETTAVATGWQVQLSATVRDSLERPLAGRSVTWSSETPAIATVSNTGLVTTLAAGEARIRAQADRGVGVGIVIASASLAPVDTVQLTPESAAIIVGGNVQLTATTRDVGGSILTHRHVAWSTSDTGVVRLSSASGGTVTVMGVAPGTATITATSEGASNRALVTVAGAGSYAKVVGGNGFTCGVTTAGRALCWGSNHSGALGTGRSNDRDSVPVEVAGGRAFSDIVAGSDHACALTTDGAAFCWGSRSEGRLGNGQSIGRDSTPAAVLGGMVFNVIAAGDGHTCALGTTGAAYCWGSNFVGSLGTGSSSGPQVCSGTIPCSSAPVAVLGGLTFTSMVSGGHHTCALTAGGAAWCWGENQEGQLGTAPALGPELCANGAPCSTVPFAVPGGHTFVTLAAGYAHTCGIDAAGALWCWGLNHLGQRGSGGATEPCRLGSSCSAAPVRVVGTHRWATVAAGLIHTCGITTSGAAHCWGVNEEGALGLGAGVGPGIGPEQCGPDRRECSTTPRAVSGGLLFVRIGLGHFHSCGTTGAGVAYCWGSNYAGQLGNARQATGPFEYSSSVPVRVAGQPQLTGAP